MTVPQMTIHIPDLHGGTKLKGTPETIVEQMRTEVYLFDGNNVGFMRYFHGLLKRSSKFQGIGELPEDSNEKDFIKILAKADVIEVTDIGI